MASGASAACAATSRWTHAASGRCHPAWSFHSRRDLVPLRRAEQRQLGQARLRVGRDPLEQRAQVLGEPLRPSRRRTGRSRTRTPPGGPPGPPPAPATGRACRAAAGRQVAHGEPGKPSPAAAERALLEGEHHLEQRRARRGRAPAPAPRPGARTARPGGRRRRAPPRAPAPSSSRNGGSPDRSVRSTRVLTKKPISPSTSTRVAPGDRRAHRQSSRRREAREQERLEGGEQ